ncbi:hypothetical protein MMPV_003692 [Pyropia vietnamensis]
MGGLAQDGSDATAGDEVDDSAANRRRTRRTRILALLLRRAPEAKGYLTCILCCTMVWSPNGRHHIATCATLRAWRAARDAVWADAVAWLDARVAARPQTTFPELLNGRLTSISASPWAGVASGMAAVASGGDSRLTPGGRAGNSGGGCGDASLVTLCADIFDAVSEEDAAVTADARAAPPKPAKSLVLPIVSNNRKLWAALKMSPAYIRRGLQEYDTGIMVLRVACLAWLESQ